MQKKFHAEDISNYSFAVTGGAGFIGSHLVEYLVYHGAKRIVILDDLSTGYKENIAAFLTKPGVEFIKGDTIDSKVCEQAFKNIDFIMHQAALCSVPLSIDNPFQTNKVNVTGFLNVLIAARNAGVKKVVYASSSSVYGNSPTLPKKETDAALPLSPYAVSKLTNELYASVFALNYGLDITGLRYFNIFGPRQNPNSQYSAAIPLFITSLIQSKSPVIYGDGSQTRDFTYIDNVVQANIKSIFSGSHSTGKVFNVAAGKQISINELFNVLCQISGKSVKPEYKPMRKGEVKDSLADISKAAAVLNYYPEVGFSEGVENTWEWFKENYKYKQK